MMHETMSPEELAVLPVFDEAMNRAIGTHLFGKDGAGNDFEAASDEEFENMVNECGTRQPLNPISVIREAFNLPQDTPIVDILGYINHQHKALLSQYEAHNIDVIDTLTAATDIINHTEAYISGYSRDIGAMATRVLVADPSRKGLQRWNSKIWVPEEDEHDRLLTFMMYGQGILNVEKFYDDHIDHMQRGVHVPVMNLFSTTSYLRQQEASTGPSYDNYAVLLGPALNAIPRRISKDESRHTRFYGTVEEELFKANPDAAIIAFYEEAENFEMPGMKGINDFIEKAKLAGLAGVLDPVEILEIQVRRINRLRIGSLNVHSDAAKQAQEKLADPDGKYSPTKLAKKKEQIQTIRLGRAEKAKRAGKLIPAFIGTTIIADSHTGELSFPLSA